jgi:hypothetical protein
LKKLQNRSTDFSSIVKTNSTFIKEKKNSHETALPLIASNSKVIWLSSGQSTTIFLRKHSSEDLNPVEEKITEGPHQSIEITPSPSTFVIKDTSYNAATTIQNSPATPESTKKTASDSKVLTTATADSSETHPSKPENIQPTNVTNDIKEKEKQSASENSKNLNVDLGVYYFPELMFNTLQGEKYSNNFGIEGTFHFGNFSIRTGAGLSITKGTNELSISYNKYLGKFNKLDSASFTWDPIHSKQIPTFYYTQKNVWDSLTKTRTANIIKSYTYLQVPLILGYEFWKNDHVSLGLRFGPIFSVLLKTEQLSDNYNPGQDRIVQINLISPDRIQTYWQFIGGIDASVGLSRRFYLELEPEFRYYYNSVYEKLANKPYSLGLRIAFLIRN